MWQSPTRGASIRVRPVRVLQLVWCGLFLASPWVCSSHAKSRASIAGRTISGSPGNRGDRRHRNRRPAATRISSALGCGLRTRGLSLDSLFWHAHRSGFEAAENRDFSWRDVLAIYVLHSPLSSILNSATRFFAVGTGAPLYGPSRYWPSYWPDAG